MTPRQAFRFGERELRELGLIPARDGALLDNRDGFFDSFPDDHVRTYDGRAFVAISRARLAELLRAEQQLQEEK